MRHTIHFINIFYCSCCPDEPAERSGGQRHGRHPRQGRDRDLHHPRGDRLLLRGRAARGPIQLPGQLARHQTAAGNRQITSFLRASKHNDSAFPFCNFALSQQ